ncbi:MAG TPA: 4-hydroxy-tetrahydrodipicolinate synthase [Syntrophomonadaceae bacterium]|nr:4-hydroxy-tetrahydrodipicolinate synthase [Syntrophomonadaceae bacterium]
MQLPSVWTAMITPFDQDLQVNYSKAAELAEYLCQHGSEGIIVSGTTGESPVLSTEEKLQLLVAVKQKVGKQVPVWCGTGSNDTAHVIELSREAEKAGADGLLLVSPYYSKPPQEGLYQHFKQVAESVSVPLMLYNIPGRTAVNMLPATMARLAEIENIVAIKEAAGDLDQVSQLSSILPPRVAIFSGDDSLTLPMLAVGAQGVVSIASHILGNEIKAMVEAYFAGQVDQARELHLKLFPAFKGLFVTTNPIPLKAALNMMGMKVGGLRLPLVEADEAQIAQVKELLQSYKLIV